ncbi:MAG: hypothetical protein AseanaTS_26540 [Candidatus Pelagadaptatus aseana]|uniref:malonyl-ACP O-methyltransferase BioC n=1 Tax=Candidatus Pelagadaptatus aseana TaxID=3120508 RepID=UPI0039B20991
MQPVIQASFPEFGFSRYIATADAPASVPIVLLHGWGCDSQCWQPLLEGLRQHSDVVCIDYLEAVTAADSVDQSLAELLQQLPEKFSVLGWSLGGMLALRVAALAPERVVGVATLAANLRFVANEQWADAMAPEVFQQFQQSFRSAPDKTLKRFAGLMAKGDSDERLLLKSLRNLSQSGLATASEPALALGLKLLGELDNRTVVEQLPVPGLHLFGQADALVPATVLSSYQALAGANQQVECLQGAGHAPHWSQTEAVLERLIRFFSTLESVAQQNDDNDSALDKKRVAASFGKAAASYDSVAGLQRQIGNRLLERVVDCSGHDRWCMDLGCGTGHFIGALQERGYQMLGLDLAEGMLEFARGQQQPSRQAHWLCADAEHLPLANHSVDAIFSSLAIQWCHDLSALFGGLKRVVKPGGKLYLATLGPRTLSELRQSWKQVDGYVHVNRFIGADQLQQALQNAGLRCLNWQQQDIVLQYDALRDLTYELKTLGAHNVNAGQGNGLTGRARIRQLRDAYEAFRMANGKLPATYEVYYMELEA